MRGELNPVGGGEPIPLTKDRLLIGNHPACDIQLSETDVGNVHCQLHYAHGWWHVHSVSLSHETRVNEQAVSNTRLQPGDVLWISPENQYKVDYSAEP